MSLVTNLSSLIVIGSTVKKIVNWVTTVVGYVHTARRRDSTRQLSLISVGGVYWA